MKSALVIFIIFICLIGFGLGMMLIERSSTMSHESVHVRSFQRYNISSHIEYHTWGAMTMPDDTDKLAQLCADRPDDCQKLADDAMLNEVVGYNMVGIEQILLLIAFLVFAIFLTLLLGDK